MHKIGMTRKWNTNSYNKLHIALENINEVLYQCVCVWREKRENQKEKV